jgi:probable HAF family extracellular repeat protein
MKAKDHNKLPFVSFFTLTFAILVLVAVTGARTFGASLYSFTDLGTLGGTYSEANDINDSGQVVGIAGTAEGTYHGFLYSGGVMTDLGTLGGSQSMARGINASGQIVGNADTSGGTYHAFLYSGGNMSDLLGGPTSGASGINASGQIVGSLDIGGGTYHGYLYSGRVERRREHD